MRSLDLFRDWRPPVITTAYDLSKVDAAIAEAAAATYPAHAEILREILAAIQGRPAVDRSLVDEKGKLRQRPGADVLARDFMQAKDARKAIKSETGHGLSNAELVAKVEDPRNGVH